MRYLRIWIALTVSALSSCAKENQPHTTDHHETKSVHLRANMIATSVDVVTLDRSGHRFHAPFYTIVLKRDGTVTYTGISDVSRIGTYQTTISPVDFGRLEAMLNKFDYFNMSKAFFTDDSDRVMIHVSRGNEEKTLSHTWSSKVPIELWAIENAIDGMIANVTDWKKSD